MGNRSLLLLPVIFVLACGGGAKGTNVATPTANADSVTKDSTTKAAAAKKLANGPHHVFDTVAAAGVRPGRLRRPGRHRRTAGAR